MYCLLPKWNTTSHKSTQFITRSSHRLPNTLQNGKNEKGKKPIHTHLHLNMYERALTYHIKFKQGSKFQAGISYKFWVKCLDKKLSMKRPNYDGQSYHSCMLYTSFQPMKLIPMKLSFLCTALFLNKNYPLMKFHFNQAILHGE